MDGNGGDFVDSSSGQGNVFNNGNALQSSTQSKWGSKSLFSAGSSDVIVFPPLAGNFNGAFVVEFWFWTNTSSSYSQMVSNASTSPHGGFTIAMANGGVSVDHTAYGSVFSSLSTSFNNSQWHHLAYVRDNSDNLSLYVDGVLEASRSWGIPQSSNQWFRAGLVGGYIDDIRITVGTTRGYSGSNISVPTAAFPDSATLSAEPCAANDWCAGESQYYIGGQATPLDISGSGTWNGQTYSGGVLKSIITITAQPSNQTAANGSASFTVSASFTNSATPSYQWQKQESGSGDFIDVGSVVSGETGSTLTLSGLTNAADNGDVYRVVVSASGAAESVTSSIATLTVADPTTTTAAPSAPAYFVQSNAAWGGKYCEDGTLDGKKKYKKAGTNYHIYWGNASALSSWVIDTLENRFIQGATIYALGLNSNDEDITPPVGMVWNNEDTGQDVSVFNVFYSMSVPITLSNTLIPYGGIYNGKPLYNASSGGLLARYESAWLIMDESLPSLDPEDPNAPVILYQNNSTSSTIPLTGWIVVNGSSPAPTLVGPTCGVGGATTTTTAAPTSITISSQPSSQTAVNGSASFSVSASVSNSTPPSFQWQKQESGSGSFNNVSGAIGSTLALSGLTNAADNGDVYRVVVSASGGAVSVTSSSATLTVDPCAANDWCAGESQYYIGGQATPLDISGSGTWNGQTYSGGVLKSIITITAQPSNQTAANGSASFTVSASFTNSATPSYQWQKQESGSGDFIDVGSVVSGEIGSTVPLSGLTNAADNGDVYRVVVSASGGAESVTSSIATLTVAPPTTTTTTTSAPGAQGYFADGNEGWFGAHGTYCPAGNFDGVDWYTNGNGYLIFRQNGYWYLSNSAPLPGTNWFGGNPHGLVQSNSNTPPLSGWNDNKTLLTTSCSPVEPLASYSVSGAADPSFDGCYAPINRTTVGGKPLYAKSSLSSFLYWNGSFAWYLSTSPGGFPSYESVSTNTNTPPVETWTSNVGGNGVTLSLNCGGGGTTTTTVAPAGFTPMAVLLTSGTSYTVPAGATSMKAWAVGGGGGGMGGAGGTAFKTWSVAGGDAVAYVAGAAGVYIAPGYSYNSTNGGDSTVTYGGVTITGRGGGKPTVISVNGVNTLSIPGGTYSGGDGGADGGAGNTYYPSNNGPRYVGGAVGGNNQPLLICAGYDGAGRRPATNVSGLLEAVALAGGAAIQSCGATAAFGSGGHAGDLDGDGFQYSASQNSGLGGGGHIDGMAGGGAVVLYFTGGGEASTTTTAAPSGTTTITISEQPKNSYAISSNDTATFSVAASINNGDTIRYQWQYYGQDHNTGESGWFDVPGQTLNSLTMSPITFGSMGLNVEMYTTPLFRCVLTGVNSPASQTTTVARWVRFDSMGAWAKFLGSNGLEPDGHVTVNGKAYSTLTLSSGEDFSVEVSDPPNYPADSSWYSSDAFTVKIQVSDDATTWSDISSANFRSNGFWNMTQVTALSGVTKYYRFLLKYNWPFTTTNGTQSSRAAPDSVHVTGARVTWP
jgi:hypothetical protein